MTDPVKTVGCGLRHSVLVKEDGGVFGCGSSKRSQLGLGDKKDFTTWKEIPELKDKRVVQLALGQHFTVALSQEGKLFGFGDNKHGQLRMNDQKEIETVTEITTSKKVKKVVCGWTHTIIQSEDDILDGWGRNDYCQLGGPTPLSVSDVYSGSEHVLAVRSADKKLVSWGWNEHGNCGNGGIDNVTVPTEVLVAEGDVKAVWAASGHNFAYIA